MIPNIFIGSSVEGRAIADAIQVGLHHDARCRVWHQAFALSKNTIDSIVEGAINSDFAIFVFSPDDILQLRGATYEAARDNVLFETGLFIGMHGKGRVFIVTPRGTDLRIPTDLLGFTAATYDVGFAKQDINGAVGAAVTQVRQAINASAWKKRRPDIGARASFKFDAHWPLKLNLRVENNQSVPVTIESIAFDFGPDAQRAPNAELRGGVFKPKFRVGVNEVGKDLYEPHMLLMPNKSIETWVPFDPDVSVGTLQGLADQKKTGTWQFRCVWLDEPPNARIFEEQL
jgi:hypothetical protein